MGSRPRPPSSSRACLLCSSPGGVPLPRESPSPKNGFQKMKEKSSSSSSSSSKLLNSGLWSVFVLRKLLHFPQWELAYLLRSMGGVSPGDWYTLCGPCSQLAKQTMELHHQIFELQRKISDKRAEAYDKLRSSFRSEERVDKQEEEKESNNIGVRCARATVREYFRVHLGLLERKKGLINNDNGDNSSLESESLESDDDDGDPEQQMSSVPPSPSSPPPAGSVKLELDSNYEDDDDDSRSLEEEHNSKSYEGQQIRRHSGSIQSNKRNIGGMKRRKGKAIFQRRINCGKVAPPGKGRYCSICRRWFLPESYPAHVKVHEGTEARRCKYCDYMSKIGADKEDLLLHEKKHEEDPNYVYFRCDKCDYTCSTHFKKYFHIRKHKIDDNVETVPSGALVCKVCSAQFENSVKVKLHLRESHGPQLNLKQYKCSECETFFTTSSTGLRLHKLQHKKRGLLLLRYQCDHCKFSCSTQASLDHHLATVHSGGKKTSIICDICGVGVVSSSALRGHKIRHHKHNPKGAAQKGNHQEQQACQHCEFVGSNVNQLNYHRKKEHPELFPFQCSKCPQSFMKKHRMTHHVQLKHPGGGGRKSK